MGKVSMPSSVSLMGYMYSIAFAVIIGVLAHRMMTVGSEILIIDDAVFGPVNDPRFTSAANMTEGFKALGAGLVDQAETIVVDGKGHLLAGAADGKIWKVNSKTGAAVPFVHVGGRPLGMALDDQNNLLVCDPVQGLLRVDMDTKQVSTMSTFTTDGKRIAYADDVDVAPDGAVYFSDACDLSPPVDMHGNVDVHGPVNKVLISGRGSGRLLRLSPSAAKSVAPQAAETLLEGLHFANGVAVALNGSFVLVCESFRSRVVRLWLEGERKGTHEVLIDRLPGLPDGISKAADGTFWIALFCDVPETLPPLMRSKWLRTFMVAFPILAKLIFPATRVSGFAIQIDEHGNVLQSIEDRDAQSIGMTTAVTTSRDTLYFGTLYNNYIGSRPLSPL